MGILKRFKFIHHNKNKEERIKGVHKNKNNSLLITYKRELCWTLNNANPKRSLYNIVINTQRKNNTPNKNLSVEKNINSKIKSLLTNPLVKSNPERQIKHKSVCS